jgi:hypothetical protein
MALSNYRPDIDGLTQYSTVLMFVHRISILVNFGRLLQEVNYQYLMASARIATFNSCFHRFGVSVGKLTFYPGSWHPYF